MFIRRKCKISLPLKMMDVIPIHADLYDPKCRLFLQTIHQMQPTDTSFRLFLLLFFFFLMTLLIEMMTNTCSNIVITLRNGKHV